MPKWHSHIGLQGWMEGEGWETERYNEAMARGWESKSVEAQQEAATERRDDAKPRMTQKDAALVREIGNLKLSLRNVLRQLGQAKDVRHRDMLELAKAELERRIAAISG